MTELTAKAEDCICQHPPGWRPGVDPCAEGCEWCTEVYEQAWESWKAGEERP